MLNFFKSKKRTPSNLAESIKKLLNFDVVEIKIIKKNDTLLLQVFSSQFLKNWNKEVSRHFEKSALILSKAFTAEEIKENNFQKKLQEVLKNKNSFEFWNNGFYQIVIGLDTLCINNIEHEIFELIFGIYGVSKDELIFETN